MTCLVKMFDADGGVLAVRTHLIARFSTTPHVICKPLPFNPVVFASQGLLRERRIRPAPLLAIVVPALPRGAVVELHVTAVQDDPTERTSCHVTTTVARLSIECHTVTLADGSGASLSLSLSPPVPGGDPEVTDAKEVAEAVAAAFKDAKETADARLVPMSARVFYKCHSLARRIVEGISCCLPLQAPPNVASHQTKRRPLFFQRKFVLKLFMLESERFLHKIFEEAVPPEDLH